MIAHSSYPENLKTIRMIAQVILKQHMNHERRNERLSALRRLIENFMDNRRSYDDVAELKIEGYSNLRTLYDLSIWKLESETHVDVKVRLRLVEETADVLLQQYEEAVKADHERRMLNLRISQMEHDGIGGFTMTVSFPDDLELP